jgi:hypothetical protein
MRPDRLSIRIAQAVAWLVAISLHPTIAWAAPGVIAALEEAPIIVVAEVERITRLAHAGYLADLDVTRSLHAEGRLPESLVIAWEEPAPSRSPRFEKGQRLLVAVGALSSASIWRIRVPDDAARAALLEVAGGGEGYLSRPMSGELDVIEHYLAVAVEAREGDAGALHLARLCAVGQPKIAMDAARRLADFEGLSDHLLPGAAHAIVDALLRPQMERTSALLLEMIAEQRPVALRTALDQRIRSLQPRVPLVLYGALGATEGRLDDAVTETLLAGESSEARVTAVRYAEGPEASAQLRALLRTDRSPAVRAEAVTRLARLDGIAALSDLTRALEDPAAPVRLAAVRAAATLDPQAVAALRSVAGNDSSDAARAAIAALSLMGREAHAVLTEMAAEHPDEAMRLLSRIAIGQPIGDRH